MVGLWINDDGVELDDRQYTESRYRRFDCTLDRRAVVNCAGWLSEYGWHGRGGRWREESSIQYAYGVVVFDDDDDSDIVDTIRANLDQFPDKSEADAVRPFREYERQT